MTDLDEAAAKEEGADANGDAADGHNCHCIPARP